MNAFFGDSIIGPECGDRQVHYHIHKCLTVLISRDRGWTGRAGISDILKEKGFGI